MSVYDNELDIVEFERHIYDVFNLDVKVKAIIAERLPVSRVASATVFLTSQQLLFCYIDSVTKLTLGDVQKMVRHMGLRAQQYIAPSGDVDYFDNIAKDKFKHVFPGRRIVSNDDLEYYRTLAPYRPALAQISEVERGVIRQYDPTSVTNWRPGVKFSYRRLLTS